MPYASLLSKLIDRMSIVLNCLGNNCSTVDNVLFITAKISIVGFNHLSHVDFKYATNEHEK